MHSGLIYGIGLLLFAPFGRSLKLFTVKELKGKDWLFKKPGMVSFPMETAKPEDITFEGTIRRLIQEEIGVSIDEVELKGVSANELQLIPGRDDIISLYGYGLFHGDTNQTFRPKDDDIVFDGWKKVRELLQQPLRRIEVDPIISHFVRHHRKVLAM